MSPYTLIQIAQAAIQGGGLDSDGVCTTFDAHLRDKQKVPAPPSRDEIARDVMLRLIENRPFDVPMNDGITLMANVTGKEQSTIIAEMAYRQADAMLEVRNK